MRLPTIIQKVMLRYYIRFLIDLYKKGLPELIFLVQIDLFSYLNNIVIVFRHE